MESARQTKRKRRNNWTPEAEKVLFVVWSRNITGLRATRKNHPVFIKMSHEMNALGYPYSVIEIKTKVHNLCSRYRDEKKVIESGAASTWPLYQSVHKIYWRGKSKSSTSDSEGSADEGYPDLSCSQKFDTVDEDYVSDASDVDSVDEAVLNCFDTMNKNMLSLIQHTNEQSQKSIALHKQMLEIQKERNEILKKMLDVFSNKWRKSTAADTHGEKQKKIKLTTADKAMPRTTENLSLPEISDNSDEMPKIEMSSPAATSSDEQDIDISTQSSIEEDKVSASVAEIKQN